jgi:hypothetical protein
MTFRQAQKVMPVLVVAGIVVMVVYAAYDYGRTIAVIECDLEAIKAIALYVAAGKKKKAGDPGDTGSRPSWWTSNRKEAVEPL